ncbi:serine hydrolase [Ferruginibacter yonginensis]|uniref:beta-lactamase n=1 Tax=Ferruginibacter yonginensis TaxID=1310416 RepID=A0ABV8QUE7_9BACT
MKKVCVWLFICVACCTSINAQVNKADSLLLFMKANPKKASLYVTVNDTVMGRFNENTMMPLASTVKILVAIEFAKQAGNNVFNKDSLIALSETDKYFLPLTDGGAHTDWIVAYQKNGRIKNDSVSLLDVARGMIIYSSNANTEYLMELLGLDNIKNNLQLFGIKNHTAIYPISSALLIYQNPKRKKERYIIDGINALNEEQYCRFSYDIHKALTYDTVLKSKFNANDLSMKFQKMWSDRLPASTTKEYVNICRILNNRKFLDTASYAVLAKVLETIMENPRNQSWLQHAGAKGGSTTWVLTKAFYATTKKGVKIELAYFFNNLTLEENEKIEGWINSFELAVLSSDNFRKKMKALFP